MQTLNPQEIELVAGGDGPVKSPVHPDPIEDPYFPPAPPSEF